MFEDVIQKMYFSKFRISFKKVPATSPFLGLKMEFTAGGFPLIL